MTLGTSTGKEPRFSRADLQWSRSGSNYVGSGPRARLVLPTGDVVPVGEDGRKTTTTRPDDRGGGPGRSVFSVVAFFLAHESPLRHRRFTSARAYGAAGDPQGASEGDHLSPRCD